MIGYTPRPVPPTPSGPPLLVKAVVLVTEDDTPYPFLLIPPAKVDSVERPRFSVEFYDGRAHLKRT